MNSYLLSVAAVAALNLRLAEKTSSNREWRLSKIDSITLVVLAGPLSDKIGIMKNAIALLKRSTRNLAFIGSIPSRNSLLSRNREYAAVSS
jgi:hypothetical protein